MRGLSPHMGLFTAVVCVVTLFAFQNVLKFTVVANVLVFVVGVSGMPFSCVMGKLGTVIILLLVATIFGLIFAPANARC